MNPHQLLQQKVIHKLEKDINNNSLTISTVSPVDDYENDPRLCLTSVHLPHTDLSIIEDQVIKPLKELAPNGYFYSPDSLHMTIKSVRVVADPPNFTSEDIEKARKVFSEVIPNHKKFTVNFYRLLLFPRNLSLVATTDPELDTIIFDLDHKLRAAGIPDDKVYSNDQYYFSNMTVARFSNPLSEAFKQRVYDLSSTITLPPYEIDSVSLLTCNAVFKKRTLIDSWNLQ